MGEVSDAGQHHAQRTPLEFTTAVMDYLLSIPSLLLLALVIALALPFASRRKPKLPHAEKDQTTQPQEEFLEGQATPSRNASQR